MIAKLCSNLPEVVVVRYYWFLSWISLSTDKTAWTAGVLAYVLIDDDVTILMILVVMVVVMVTATNHLRGCVIYD